MQPIHASAQVAVWSLVVFGFFLLPGLISAQEWDTPDAEQAILAASDPVNYDYLGWSVAIDGEVAVAGSYANDDAAINAGAAYVFRYDEVGQEWTEEQKLVPDGLAASDYFGISVAVDGDRIAVGAYLDDDVAINAGTVYIFKYDADEEGWVEEGQVTADDGAASDYFGYNISLSGDVLVGRCPLR